MKKDKLYKKLVELYKKVYLSIGLDFESIDKIEDWYTLYNIDSSAEDSIVNDFINKCVNLSTLEKRVLKTNYYMGFSLVRK